MLRTPDGAAWQLTVAADLATLEAETTTFRRGLLPAAAWLGAALFIAALLIVRTALKPLGHLREAVSALGSGGEETIRRDFPSEVAPLVDDLNAMLDKNARLRARGEAQAANLAHALKTPAAVLRNEIDRMRADGAMDVSLADEAVQRIADTASRHASAAGAHPDERPAGEMQDAVPILNEVTRAIRRLFPDHDIALEAPDRLDLPLSLADQHELFGNLIENAGKFARGHVRIALRLQGAGAVLSVADDGTGIPGAERGRVLKHGVRLDERTSGSGLGLAIVEEIVERHGGALTLGESELGGLRVRVDLPASKAS